MHTTSILSHLNSIRNLGALLLAVFFLNSCKSVYQCGDDKASKIPLASKRLKTVVSERDQLCERVSTLSADKSSLQSALDKATTDNSNLKDQNGRLKSNLNDLQKKYDDLMNENLSQSAQFSQTLRNKTNELQEKEKALSEREAALRDLQRRIAIKDSITQNLNNLIRNALLSFPSDELSVEVRNGKVYVSMADKLLFRSGSAQVENKGRDAIKLVAEVLNKNTDIDVLVEGHTDNIPIRTAQFRDNWDLSVARATSIVRMLCDDFKLQPTRITASGKGEFMPRAGNDSAEGRALNRRTEIILSPKLEELMNLFMK